MIDVSVQNGSLQTRRYRIDGKFPLESGDDLSDVDIAYETYGRLNIAGDNAVMLCHALTGSARAGSGNEERSFDRGWWAPLIGPGCALDTDRYFVVCSNILGSCYGTTGPASVHPATGVVYGKSFPRVTVRDMVRAQHDLLRHLDVSQVIVIGGSLGGMQALEWAVMFPEVVRAVVPIAASAQHSAWAIAWNYAARQAIYSDPDWLSSGGQHAPHGLALARTVSMISFRAWPSFERRFSRNVRLGRFEVENYLDHQGNKLVRRFDPRSYIVLTRAMDGHDVAAGRGSVESVLGGISVPVLCIGIDSDVLYPDHEQQTLARLIPDARYAEITSPHGHDAFLIEFEQLGNLLTSFLGELS
jgi:homoserine O-acetyltransferase